MENNLDPFTAFIHHAENQRQQEKLQSIFKDKLKDFTSDGFPKKGIDFEKVKEEGYNSSDDEYVTDMAEFAKSSKTLDMNPDRFKCILNPTALPQKHVKREYLDRLPAYMAHKKEVK